MTRRDETRAGEVAIEPPAATDAGLVFIGRIRTPWTDRLKCPRQGRSDGPLCRIEVFEPWRAVLDGLVRHKRLEVLYWLHLSRRDLVRQTLVDDGIGRGTFSLRSPVRPNPIGSTIAKLISVETDGLMVRGMDCVDGTPLLDIKPDRPRFTPITVRQPRDDAVG